MPAAGDVSTPRAPSARLSRRRKLLFAVVPLLALLAVGEVLARSFREGRTFSPLRGGSYRDQRIDLIRRGYPAAHDPLLGYVPRPGFASADNRWGAMVSIDAAGLRTNGPGLRPTGARGVLAVGDSFTFGDQVADDATWPARLERKLQRPVWNGGVFGYSFAQTVLRAEQLLDRLAVDTLVVSVIPDDIKRCEMSHRFTEVPWYDLVGGELVLRNVPVPDTDRSELDRQYVRKLLGYSALCDTIFWNTVPTWWVGDQREVYVHPRGTGSVIAEKLLLRLAATCRARGVPLLLVLQDVAEPADWSRADGRRMLAYAHTIGVPCLDLVSAFDALAAADPSLRQRFFWGHMSPDGNAWVAEQIAAALAH
jgi:GNAT superfamily N-acetyltransferase